MRITRSLATVAALATVAVLAACSSGASDGGQTTGSGPAASEGGDGAGELTFFSWDNQQTMQPLIDEFQKENPGITIKFSYAPPVQEYQDTLSRNLLAGTAADVFILGNKTEQAGGGYVKDLSDLDAVKVLSPFNVKMYSYDGKPYGVSVATWGGGFAVNQDLVEKAGITTQPATWDELLADLKKIQDTGVTPLLEPSDGITTTIMAKIGYADSQGGGLDQKLYDGTTTFSDAWTQPLDEWSQLYTQGLVPKSAAGLTGDQVLQEFLGGRAAIIATGTWNVATARKSNINLAWWPVPGAKAGQDFWAGAASPAYAINAKAKNPVAAEKWLNFLASPAGVKIYHETTGSIMTTSNYPDQDLDPSIADMYKDVVAGKVWCTWQAWPGASTTDLDAVMVAGMQAVMLGTSTAADMTKALDDKYATVK